MTGLAALSLAGVATPIPTTMIETGGGDIATIVLTGITTGPAPLFTRRRSMNTAPITAIIITGIIATIIAGGIVIEGGKPVMAPSIRFDFGSGF